MHLENWYKNFPDWKDIDKTNKIIAIVIVLGSSITTLTYSRLVYGYWETLDESITHFYVVFICAAWIFVGVLIKKIVDSRK